MENDFRKFLDGIYYDPLTGQFTAKSGKVYTMDYFRLKGVYYRKHQAALYCMTKDPSFLLPRDKGGQWVTVIDQNLTPPARYAITNLKVSGMPKGTILVKGDEAFTVHYPYENFL